MFCCANLVYLLLQQIENSDKFTQKYCHCESRKFLRRIFTQIQVILP